MTPRQIQGLGQLRSQGLAGEGARLRFQAEQTADGQPLPPVWHQAERLGGWLCRSRIPCVTAVAWVGAPPRYFCMRRAGPKQTKPDQTGSPTHWPERSACQWAAPSPRLPGSIGGAAGGGGWDSRLVGGVPAGRGPARWWVLFPGGRTRPSGPAPPPRAPGRGCPWSPQDRPRRVPSAPLRSV